MSSTLLKEVRALSPSKKKTRKRERRKRSEGRKEGRKEFKNQRTQKPQ